MSNERKIKMAKSLLQQENIKDLSEWSEIELSLSENNVKNLRKYSAELHQAVDSELGKDIHISIENARELSELRKQVKRDVNIAMDETHELEKIAEELQDRDLGKIAGKEEHEVKELGRKLEELDKKGKKVDEHEQKLIDTVNQLGIGHGELHKELEKRARTVGQLIKKSSDTETSTDTSPRGPDPDGDPWIVSISDIHGFYTVALSCLKCLEDKGFKPIINVEKDGSVEWAGNNYKLIFNGDVIDRGGKNEEAFQLAAKLVSSGNASYNIGNHELAAMMPEIYRIGDGYYKELNKSMGKKLLEEISNGFMQAATKGYEHVYVHAGQNRDFSVKEVNQTLREVAEQLETAWESDKSDYITKQGEINDKISLRDDTKINELNEKLMKVFGWDIRNGYGGRGPLSGLAWMDWQHFNSKGPKQVVGHSKVDFPQTKHGSVNANTIRNNVKGIIERGGTKIEKTGKGNFKKRLGGESITVEQPDGTLFALTREKDGNVVLTPKERL